MRRPFALALTFALAGLASCKQDPAAEGGACKKQDDCLDGLSCVEGICKRAVTETPGPTPSGYCATLAAMAGSWTFDTTVVGAETLAPRGINGHFQMTVTVDNCEGKIELSKSGYDDVTFAKDKVQNAEAALVESTEIPAAATAVVSLKSKPTHEMTFVVREGQLFGYYSYADSEWRRAGIWGYLRGVKIGETLEAVEDFGAQPCEVRCMTQCDTTRRRADQTLDEASLASCLAACGTETTLVGCGEGAALPEALVLGLEGPVETREALCEAAGKALLSSKGKEVAGPPVECLDEPEIKGRPVARKLNKSRLDGSFLNAEVVEIGYFDGAYVGRLVLGLQTKAGWYFTDELVDLSVSRAGGVKVEVDGIKLQPRDMLSPAGREVVAEIRTKTTDSDLGRNEVAIDENKLLVLCSVGDPPTCILTNLTWSTNRTLIEPKKADEAEHPNLGSESGETYVAILPDDRVSISTPADAREGDRALAGIYHWPE